MIKHKATVLKSNLNLERDDLLKTNVEFLSLQYLEKHRPARKSRGSKVGGR